MDGDVQALYWERSEAGMAALAAFVVERTGGTRAALWAHNDHVSKHLGGVDSLGYRLASALANSYYAVAFFAYQGSSRAWDPAGKIGVLSYPIAAAPSFTIEGAMMTATSHPAVAWLPLRRLPQPLRAWLAVPRFARELGAVYMGEARSMILMNASLAFDALVVIKSVHDSSPTPTGLRRVGM
jgi:erythromycin esterase-like protein